MYIIYILFIYLTSLNKKFNSKVLKMNTFLFVFICLFVGRIFTQTHGLDHVLLICNIGDTIKLSKLLTYNKCINQAVTQRKECEKHGFWASPSGLQHWPLPAWSQYIWPRFQVCLKIAAASGILSFALSPISSSCRWIWSSAARSDRTLIRTCWWWRQRLAINSHHWSYHNVIKTDGRKPTTCLPQASNPTVSGSLDDNLSFLIAFLPEILEAR